MRGNRSAEWVRQHAQRLIFGIDDSAREALALDPLGAVEVLGVRVDQVHESFDTECGIDGLYFAEDPPRMCVTVAASVGRTNFTILHEFGHHLISGDDETNMTLLDLDDDHLIEEDLCDAIAAALLIPAGVIREHIGPKGPTAEEVVGVFNATKASREASCVAAASRLRGPGYVVLAERDGTVRFAANASTPFRIARNTKQESNHLLERAGRRGRARGEARLRFASGSETPLMHADVVESDGYVFGVFTQGQAAWVSLNLLGDRQARANRITCMGCGNSFPPGGEPCSRCGQHRCYNCGTCGCAVSTSLREKRCGSCLLTKKLSQFSDDGDVCTDCAWA